MGIWIWLPPVAILAGLAWIRWRTMPRALRQVRLTAELHGLFSRETYEAVAEARLWQAVWRWLWLMALAVALPGLHILLDTLHRLW